MGYLLGKSFRDFKDLVNFKVTWVFWLFRVFCMVLKIGSTGRFNRLDRESGSNPIRFFLKTGNDDKTGKNWELPIQPEKPRTGTVQPVLLWYKIRQKIFIKSASTMTAPTTKNWHIQTWLALGPDPVQIYLHMLLNGIDFDQTIPIVDPDLARRWIALVSAFGLLFADGLLLSRSSFMSLFFILFLYCLVHSTSGLGYWFFRLTF